MYGGRGNLDFSWQFMSDWKISAGIQAEYTRAGGSQTQTRYESNNEGPAGVIGTIDEQWESAFLTGSIGISFLF